MLVTNKKQIDVYDMPLKRSSVSSNYDNFPNKTNNSEQIHELSHPHKPYQPKQEISSKNRDMPFLKISNNPYTPQPHSKKNKKQLKLDTLLIEQEYQQANQPITQMLQQQDKKEQQFFDEYELSRILAKSISMTNNKIKNYLQERENSHKEKNTDLMEVPYEDKDKQNNELLGNATFRPQNNGLSIFAEKNNLNRKSKKCLKELINCYSQKEPYQFLQEANKPKPTQRSNQNPMKHKFSSQIMLTNISNKTKYEALLEKVYGTPLTRPASSEKLKSGQQSSVFGRSPMLSCRAQNQPNRQSWKSLNRANSERRLIFQQSKKTERATFGSRYKSKIESTNLKSIKMSSNLQLYRQRICR